MLFMHFVQRVLNAKYTLMSVWNNATISNGAILDYNLVIDDIIRPNSVASMQVRGLVYSALGDLTKNISPIFNIPFCISCMCHEKYHKRNVISGNTWQGRE